MQFLLFPHVFKRLVSQGHQKESLCGNGLKVAQRKTQVLKRVENIVGKGEKLGHHDVF